MGCGRVAPKSQLLRIAGVRDGRAGTRLAVHDEHGTMPGRGAYVCRGDGPAPALAACLTLALDRGGIPRGLRAAVTVDPKLVESVSR